SDYGLNANWNIRARLQYGGVQWLTIDPAIGVIEEDQSQVVTVNFDATNLEPGTYNANIRISNNSINEQLVIVPVTLVVSEPVMYTLTLLVNPDDAGVVTGSGTYTAGTVVTVNAVANEGYEFINWTDADDNVVSDVAENEITVNEDLTFIANFELTVNVFDIWESQLSIYPNPASDIINFISNDNIRKLELFTLTGQKVYGAEVNHNNYKLDVSGLPQGFYIVKLTNMEGEIHTTRILIAR
ncbi:MAG: T9SS C-terminal target domain-containing protein, partial [Bacteroidetes bacterium]